MPGIYLLRRHWAIASDDFVFPSAAELCLRVAWLITIAVLFGIHHGSFGCPNGHLLRNYYIGAIVILSIGIIHTAITMGISMRGTIRDDHPRRHIKVFLYLKAAILLPEAAWVIVATYWAFGYSYTCDWSVYWAVRGAVICAWIVGFWIFVGILLVFDPLGSAEHRVNMGDVMSKRGNEYRLDSSKSNNIRVWETRCRCLCCCIAFSQENDQAFSDVSKLVADYFKDIDLVPSDVAAGLMLVEEQQKGIEGDLSAIVIDSVPSSQSGPATLAAAVISDARNTAEGSSAIMTGEHTPKAWMTIPMMEHYMKFALGSYGWPFYMYSNFFTGLCRLCASCRCCACVREETQVHSDNVCECHTAAIRQLTKIQDQDLIHVSFHNKYREVPFYVAVDRRFNNVVVSIRGTLSLQDALTDMSARGVCLPIDGISDSTCHDAMMDCAQYIKAQLEGKHLLERAFSSLQGGGQLVIVGHSLGAGVAALLAVLLRPQYPDNLACFAFSPPGGLMSASASHHARDFVCSVIVGQDIIPRLAMPSLWELKVKVLRALCNSSTPKYKILATGCFRMLCNCVASPTSTGGSGELTPLTDRQLQRYASVTTPLEEALKRAEDYAKEMLSLEWPVHPPGQILHIVEEEEHRFCSGEPQYTAVWARPEDFGSILISHKMVLDHFPDVVARALGHLNDKNFVPRARRLAGCVPGSDLC
ncbi:hypothetical protein ACOMHN_031584 [Nucella lapillus]